ncbi:YtxH domain-containing protein [Actinomadura sp. 21ATH]|uniref:YtxH domain-containing protein n=1 Tax=Actinomadura sp. 21ATH TaxID=1735444 RepID=UPI0035C22594
MKHRAMFFAGAAVGYVLGTKAGRERYEQMKQASQRFTENPRVQEYAEVLRTKGGEIAEAARDRVPEQIGSKMPGKHQDDMPEEYKDPRQETTTHGTAATPRTTL